MVTTISAQRKRSRRLFVWVKSFIVTLAGFFWRLARRVTRPLRQIPFKIGLAYTATTLGAVVAAELLLAGGAGWVLFGTDAVPNAYAGAVASGARRLGGVLERHPGGQPAFSQLSLTQRLDAVYARMEYDFLLSRLGPSRSPGPVSAIMDFNGRVVACAPGVPFQVGRPLTDQLTTDDAILIRTAASLPDDRGGIARRDADGSIIAAAPIIGSAGKRVGLLAVRSNRGLRPDELAGVTLIVVLFTIPLVLLFGGITGALFGALAARPLTRRLKAMSGAALAWGQGDFSAAITDRSGDEIGELGRRLSAMAGELQRHIRAQQKLATLEERNRLARDLHDTVKQQAFAAAMQLGAARTVLSGDSGPAGVFISQAEKLINKVQEDLTALIHELRPAPGGGGEAGAADAAGMDLSALLREEVLEWSQSSGIPADVRGAERMNVSEDIHQALLRIAQEALANVARHSRASRVEAELRQEGDGTVHLTLADNGEGFDPVFTPRGMGLYSMRDRALSLPAGRFSLETAPGAGVTIHVSCAGGTSPGNLSLA